MNKLSRWIVGVHITVLGLFVCLPVMAQQNGVLNMAASCVPTVIGHTLMKSAGWHPAQLGRDMDGDTITLWRNGRKFMLTVTAQKGEMLCRIFSGPDWSMGRAS